MKQWSLNLRAKLVVWWVTSAVLLVAVANFIGFRTALDAQFQQLRQTLMAIATTGALSIDGEMHRQVAPHSSSVKLPAYQALVERLRMIRNANPNIRYVYTMVPSEVPGRWYYVGDAEERPPHRSLPGEPYDVSRYPAMVQGLTAPSADPTMTLDEWGALLSGYAPIRDDRGAIVGVLGVDMSGEHVLRTQEAVRQAGLAVLLMTILMAVLLGVQIARSVSSPLRQLVVATRRIGQGDLAYRVPVQSHDEVGLLAQSFNRMAQRLTDSLEQLRAHVLSTILSLSRAIEAKDRHTRGHSVRVQHYAVKIARELGMSDEQVEIISEMSLLHDLGKIGVKEDILGKPARLSDVEFNEIKRHPEVGYRILLPLKLSKEALEIVLYHHEKVNGQGYPAGLREAEIPLPVGVVTVADAFDAMTGYRPYRPVPMSCQEAVAELRRCAGTQFIPEAVDALVAVLQRDGKLPAP